MASSLELGVNIDHVATLRQARYRTMLGSPVVEPDPVEAALLAARDEYAPLRARALEDLDLLAHPETVPLAMKAAAERPVPAGTGKAVCRILGVAGTPKAVSAILDARRG